MSAWFTWRRVSLVWDSGPDPHLPVALQVLIQTGVGLAWGPSAAQVSAGSPSWCSPWDWCHPVHEVGDSLSSSLDRREVYGRKGDQNSFLSICSWKSLIGSCQVFQLEIEFVLHLCWNRVQWMVLRVGGNPSIVWVFQEARLEKYLPFSSWLVFIWADGWMWPKCLDQVKAI